MTRDTSPAPRAAEGRSSAGYSAPWLGGETQDPWEGAGGPARAAGPPAETDLWPTWVKGYVVARRHSEELVPHFHRRSAHVARPYPEAYFLNRDKGEHGLLDLSHRVFTRAALEERESGAHKGLTPFQVFVARRFNGPVIRSWTFYHRRSITRQVLHACYRLNLRHSSRLRWQARRSAEVLAALKAEAVEIPVQGGASLWTLASTPPGPALDPQTLRERMRSHTDRGVAGMVTLALTHLGAATHDLLTDLVVDALGGPPADDSDAPPPAEDVEPARLAVPLLSALRRLDPEDRELLIAVGEGLSYDEVLARYPRYRSRPRLSEAVCAVNRVFIEILEGSLERELPQLRPKRLMRLLFDTLLDLVPTLTEEETP